MTTLQLTPNEIVAADGSVGANARSGRQNDLIVSELHGRLFEQSFRGRIFRATVAAFTVVAANASPLVAGTGQPILGLNNPSGSAKVFEILKLIYATTSGTPGGPLLWNYIPNSQSISAAPSANAIFRSFLGAPASAPGSVAQVYQNVALTGSSVGQLCGIAAAIPAVAATGTQGPSVSYEEGELILPPNGMLALAATAAGTAHLMGATIVWAELPFTA